MTTEARHDPCEDWFGYLIVLARSAFTHEAEARRDRRVARGFRRYAANARATYSALLDEWLSEAGTSLATDELTLGRSLGPRTEQPGKTTRRISGGVGSPRAANSD